MKYLSIDYGEKKIGIAISDAEGRIAFPKKIIYNRGQERILAQLKELIKEQNVSRIVVGLPLGAQGEETEQSAKTRAFTDFLHKETTIAIDFENEFLTTHMAERMGVTREHVDEAAAALILQSYLDRINRH